MKAWLVEEVDPGATPRFADIAPPTPNAGQHLVRVEAAGLNFLDALMVQGKYQVRHQPPFVLGVELVGRILEPASSGAVRLPAGTRIAASTTQGAFAEIAAVDATRAMRIDDDIKAEDAICLRGSMVFALYALRERGRLQRGERVLITAAAGGVGHAAMQISKLLGAYTIALTAGQHKIDECKATGADAVIDYSAPDWIDTLRKIAPEKVDVVFDSVGGEIGAQSLRSIAWHGRYLVIGFSSGTIGDIPANRLLLNEATAIGVLWGEARSRNRPLEEELTREVFDLARRGLLRPKTTVFPFEEGNLALAALAGRNIVGKGVLSVSSD